MNRLGLMAVLVLAGTSMACSETHDGNEDAGTDITFDATLPDAGPPPGETCGNGMVDPGEMCDDGNDVAGDGCDPDCQREAFCGDGTTDADEVCDDGNNRSNDGCRSDCQSDETCGNGIVDFAAGEVCDGEPACGDDCMSVTGCGDGTVEPPETCENDPPNTDRWDGCDAACQTELAVVVNALSLAGRMEGCDFNGDGSPDNAFARALGLIAGVLGPFIEMAVIDGDTRLLLAMQGLDDPAAANDDDFRIAWLIGQDADMDPSNDFSGSGEFLVAADAIDETGAPLTSVQSSVSSSMLAGGPEDIPLPIGFLPIELRQGQVQGTTRADGGELYEITDGLLCGGIPTMLLSLIGGFAGDMLMTDPPCDGGAPAELLDVIIAGGSVVIMDFPVRFSATPPDLDLDGDGLEGFEVLSESEDGSECQPVVTACIDGNGDRIEGRGCYSQPEIADGYSAAFNFTAIRAFLAGLGGMTMPEPPPPPGP